MGSLLSGSQLVNFTNPLAFGSEAGNLSGSEHDEVSAHSPSSLCPLDASASHLVGRRRLGRRPALQPDAYGCRRTSWIWYTRYHSPSSTWTSGRTIGPYFPYNHHNNSSNYYN